MLFFSPHANRNVIFKISILSILCYYWMQVVAEKFSVCFTLIFCLSSHSVWLHSAGSDILISLACSPQCWESMVGQALYRLVFFDFLFLMLGSFFGEFLRKWVYFFFKGNKVHPLFFPLIWSHHWFSSTAWLGESFCRNWVSRSSTWPEMSSSSSTLRLWSGTGCASFQHFLSGANTVTGSFSIVCLPRIGIYFSPLLPVIQILKCLIFFYVKKVNPRPCPFQQPELIVLLLLAHLIKINRRAII